MRNLARNQRTLSYASWLKDNPILDDYSNETLEVEPIYAEKKTLKMNYSPNVGEISTEVFGSTTNYSRVISHVGKTCPLKKKDHVWINDEKYEVVKVADSLNSWLIALKEIV